MPSDFLSNGHINSSFLILHSPYICPMIVSTAANDGLVLYPNAKINLGLIIKGKRPDGYHLLETLMYPVHDLRDKLSLMPSEAPGCQLQMQGIPIDGSMQDNLCVKAYERLKAEVPNLPGVQATLEKRIPAGAGLGGGSADAAAMFQGLNELFELGISQESLAAMAGELGADVPFFLYNRPLLAKGIGTEFEAIPFELKARIELIIPEIHSSTVAAYRSLDASACDPSRNLKNLLALPINHWRKNLVNDLEKPVFSRYPELKRIKKVLYQKGAVYAAMSGSGSAVFGLFEEN